jgi:hypothetical protein
MSEALQSFRVRKQTGTHGDVFAAAGLADLLTAVDQRVQIRDVGSDFEIRSAHGIDAIAMARIPQAPGYPFLQVKKVVAPRGAQDVVDYEAEKAKADRRKALRVQGPGRRGGTDPEAITQIQEEVARDDWRLLQVINVLGGYKTSNALHRTIVGLKPAAFGAAVAASLDRLSGNTGVLTSDGK